ncbi:nitrous oxide-stimulated promoter family protein [Peptococcaceae bacterium 1198_IL3148]
MQKIDRDIDIVLKFIETYCQHNHQNHHSVTLHNKSLALCEECKELSNYAIKRRQNCPKNPKPACKNCDIHCYTPKYREKIKQAMKFSGIYYIKRGRIDYLFHYFR